MGQTKDSTGGSVRKDNHKPLPMCSRCSIRAASQARWVDPDPSPSSQCCARCGYVGRCWTVYGGVE